MTRKALALLPVYMLAMLLVAAVGLVISVIGFIPMMIAPKMVVPIRDRIMAQFSQLMAQIAIKQMMKARPQP